MKTPVQQRIKGAAGHLRDVAGCVGVLALWIGVSIGLPIAIVWAASYLGCQLGRIAIALAVGVFVTLITGHARRYWYSVHYGAYIRRTSAPAPPNALQFIVTVLLYAGPVWILIRCRGT